MRWPGPVIGELAPTAGLVDRERVRLEQIGRLGAGAGGVERGMLQQPDLFGGGAGMDRRHPGLHGGQGRRGSPPNPRKSAIPGASGRASAGPSGGAFRLIVSGRFCYSPARIRARGPTSPLTRCGRGGTGRRAALRSLWGNPWKFESSRPHQSFLIDNSAISARQARRSSVRARRRYNPAADWRFSHKRTWGRHGG